MIAPPGSPGSANGTTSTDVGRNPTGPTVRRAADGCKGSGVEHDRRPTAPPPFKRVWFTRWDFAGGVFTTACLLVLWYLPGQDAWWIWAVGLLSTLASLLHWAIAAVDANTASHQLDERISEYGFPKRRY